MARQAAVADLDLSGCERDFLEMVIQQMPIVADLSRADLLLYTRKSPKELLILSHAQPHSLAHVYYRGRTERLVPAETRPEIVETLDHGTVRRDQRSIIAEGAPVVRETLPVYYPPNDHPHLHSGDSRDTSQGPRVVAALVIVTNLIEHERHKFRSEVYRRELRKLQAMLLGGLVTGAENLSPFGEQDGILFVDHEGIIRYASGIAANLYRRIGYIDTLVGRPLRDLDTSDEPLRQEALAQGRCLELEAKESDRYWSRKVIPIVNYAPVHLSWWQRFRQLRQPQDSGVIVVLHDDTDSRRQDEELRIKNAMIQEVHHRVKNNLQTIAGLLRMQIRRVHSDEARLALDEALNRILSVAVIHEFLSNRGSNIINIKDVSARIITQFQHGILGPDKHIAINLAAEPIYLPARQATACSLIINELLQNSIEHGFERKKEGNIELVLEDNGEEVIIEVADDGDGVSDDFDLSQANSLGLQIVRILVEDDLKGSISLERGISGGEGLTVKIVFSKTAFGGEYGWIEGD